MRFDYLKILAVLSLSLVTNPLLADSYLTRFSELEIIDVKSSEGEGFIPALTSNGRVVSDTQCERCLSLHIDTGIYWREDADVIVLFQNSGGNLCPGHFQFVLLLKNTQPRASKASDTCSDIVLGKRVSYEAVELDIATSIVDLTHITLRYDGTTMEQIEVPRNDSDWRVAGAGEDVTRWVGEDMYSILDHPTERQRFAKIMSPKDLHNLIYHSYSLSGCALEPVLETATIWEDGVVYEARIVDGFLIVGHCEKFSSSFGLIAIEVATGQPYVLIYNSISAWVYQSRDINEYLEKCQERRIIDVDNDFNVYGCLNVYGAALDKLPELLAKISRELLSYTYHK